MEWEGSEADNEPSSSNEMHSRVLMLEEPEWNTGPLSDMMLVVSHSHATPADTENYDLALPGTSTQSTGVLALPPPATTPMDTTEPVMTVAVPTSMTVVSTQTGKFFLFCVADRF